MSSTSLLFTALPDSVGGSHPRCFCVKIDCLGLEGWKEMFSPLLSFTGGHGGGEVGNQAGWIFIGGVAARG